MHKITIPRGPLILNNLIHSGHTDHRIILLVQKSSSSAQLFHCYTQLLWYSLKPVSSDTLRTVSFEIPIETSL